MKEENEKKKPVPLYDREWVLYLIVLLAFLFVWVIPYIRFLFK